MATNHIGKTEFIGPGTGGLGHIGVAAKPVCQPKYMI
jgi:hypothetical protein